MNDFIYFFLFLLGRLSDANKIAIVASVSAMVAVVIGVTAAIIYCQRRGGKYKRPTLIDDMKTQDDNRLWAIWCLLLLHQ